MERTGSTRYVPLLLLVAAIPCWGFAHWGLETTAGRAAFDEMAGIIPMVVGILGIVFALCAAVIGWLNQRR
jgi:hypothetical protein